jgi:hypothetical protein
MEYVPGNVRKINQTQRAKTALVTWAASTTLHSILSVTNALAYFAAASVMKKKSLMTTGVFSQHFIFFVAKNNVSDKLSGLFCSSISDEEKKFYDNGCLITTLHFLFG